VLFGTLLRQHRIGVKLRYPLISRIGFNPRGGMNANPGFFEKPEIMPSPVAKRQANDLSVRLIHHNLRL